MSLSLSSNRAADHRQAGLGIASLDATVSALINRGVARSTSASYDVGKRRYLSFCAHLKCNPLPVDETTVLCFVAYLSSSSLSYKTVRTYLSVARHMQIVSNLPDPALASFSRVNYALRGLRRETPGRKPHNQLAITPNLLLRIYTRWSQGPQGYYHIMLWAAFCLGFSGFTHSGEFTCPSWEAFTPDMLSPQDVAVDTYTSPSHLAILLKRSKNDPFAAGTTLHLRATGQVLCPVFSMLGYLAIRPHRRGPLFIFEDGSTLSRPRLVESLRQVLGSVGVDYSSYSGYSFRIGAATTAARMGVSDSLIKTLGRWKPSAFMLYIRTPWQTLAEVSPTLAKSPLATALP